MKTPSITRRDFVRLGTGAAVAGAAVKSTLLEPAVLAAQTATDRQKIRFASIGTGIRGCDLLRSARKVKTGILVETADLYDMHQKAGLEAYGADVPTSRDYRRLLDRIEAHPEQALRERMSLPVWEKAWVATRSMLAADRGHRRRRWWSASKAIGGSS